MTNDDRELDRILDRWFREGPNEAPDRVIHAVEEGIGRQSQRSAWRLDPRVGRLDRALGAVAAVAAAVGIAVVGIGLISGRGVPVVGGTSPSPSPSPQPSVAASAPAAEASVSWTFAGTIPEGWEEVDGSFASDEGVLLEILHDLNVMAADCALGPEAGVGRTSAEIVGALATRDGLAVMGPEPASVGGLDGRQVVLSVDPAWTGTCDAWDGTEPFVPLLGSLDEKNFWHYIGIARGTEAHDEVRLVVLDVPGGNVVIAVWVTTPERLADDEAAVDQILDGLTFTVPGE
jgi:hypothetical protein